MNPTPAANPRKFAFDSSITQDLPVLSAADLSDLTAVLKALARGTYPRQDAVPTALNAYNLTGTAGGKKSWAYFHEITEIPEIPPAAAAAPAAADAGARPRIDLDEDVVDDLNTPWQGMRPDAPKLDGPTANYRFLCFIHKHRITTTRASGGKVVYTISIWDREFNWLSWHDMYPHERDQRQRATQRFWAEASAPGLPFLQAARRRDLMIRWRMAYHACERTEAALRDSSVSPRHTLWAVMAVGVHHMNHGASTRHVNLVPDDLEHFGGSRDDLLPTLFVRLLWLCMRAPQAGREGEWDGRTDGFDADPRLRAFVEQFRIVDRMSWMGKDVRRTLKMHVRDGSFDWLSGVTWFFPALRIPA